jgi:hypothetical protein
MLFEKVDRRDPLGPLAIVWTFPIMRNTGHGENLAGKRHRWGRRPRHVPKVGHRKEMPGCFRTEPRHNEARFLTEPFAPEFMQFTSWAGPIAPTTSAKAATPVRPEVQKVRRGPTLVERYLIGRRK